MKLLRKLFGSQPRTLPSTVRLLSKIMKRADFKVLYARTPDRRRLVESAARECGVEEFLIWEKLSALAGLPMANNVEVMELSAISRGLSYSLLRQAGAIALVSDGMVSGYVCTDPELLQIHIPGAAQTRLFLAPWIVIAKALDASERLYLETINKQSETKKRYWKETARSVLELIIREALEKNESQIIADTEGSKIRYRFGLDDEAHTHGIIDQRITPFVVELLEAVQSQENVKEGLDEFGATKIEIDSDSRPDGTKIYRVSLLTRSDLKLETSIVSFNAHCQDDLVLVVDDNPTFGNVLERFLDKIGLSVIRVESCEKASEMIISGKLSPSLIICDVHMPGMNGFEFLKVLRSNQSFDYTPIVMLTSDDHIETELRLIEQGADAFVVKTEDPRILCAHIKRLITKRKAA